MASTQYEAYDEDALNSLVRDSEIVSFDFFDTLVTRFSATPEAVQHYVGYLLSLQESCLTDFFHRRKRAEEIARTRHPDVGDVNLDMIYAEFPVNEQWSIAWIALAQSLEEKIEHRFALPRFAVARLLEYAKALNKRVIVVSDSYFPRRFIENILEKFCLRTLVDEIYVSSERKARKDTGELWRLITIKESVSGKRLVHFGDNPHSDVATAKRFGLKCVHLLNPVPLIAARGFRYSVNQDWRSDILFGPLFARYGNSPIVPFSSGTPFEITEDADLGYVGYGPILLVFFAWLAENPAIKRMNQLYFPSREGFFLKRLYDRLCEQFGFDDLPPSHYLPISRRAVNTASQAVVFDPWQVIDGADFEGTVEDFMKVRLGLELQWPSKFVLPVSLPRDREYLSRILTILAPQILSRAEQECDAMRCYCQQVGLLEGELVGLVDVGYSGTIQAGLQLILSRSIVGFYMVTSPRVSKVTAGGGLAFGCFQDALYGDMLPDGFMRKTLLLEALLTAPHGQLAKFERAMSGVAEPIYLENGVSQHKFHCLERIFEGALNYCVDSIESGGREVLGAIIPARLNALNCLDAVLSGEIRVSEHLSSSLFLEDNFTGRGEIPCMPGAR